MMDEAGDDILDSRNIEKRIQVIKGLGKEANETLVKDLAILEKLKANFELDRWLFGITFISDEHKIEAIQQDFDEFDWISDKMPSPLYSIINWQELAKEYYEQTYDEITIDGIVYYYK